MMRFILIVVCVLALVDFSYAKKGKKAEKIGKNVLDYSETDIYKLEDQWNDNDDEYDPSEDDDDPRYKKPSDVKLDPSILKDDPEAFLRASKKGKPLMMFATIAGVPNRKHTETISTFWQSSLFNANIQMKRYVIADNRILIQLDDGSTAWEIKDFIVKQPDCESVEIENQKFPGAASNKKTEL